MRKGLLAVVLSALWALAPDVSAQAAQRDKRAGPRQRSVIDCHKARRNGTTCLACNIYFEARGEPISGQVKVTRHAGAPGQQALPQDAVCRGLAAAPVLLDRRRPERQGVRSRRLGTRPHSRRDYDLGAQAGAGHQSRYQQEHDSPECCGTTAKRSNQSAGAHDAPPHATEEATHLLPGALIRSRPRHTGPALSSALP